jgi:hypothetical protein
MIMPWFAYQIPNFSSPDSSAVETCCIFLGPLDIDEKSPGHHSREPNAELTVPCEGLREWDRLLVPGRLRALVDGYQGNAPMSWELCRGSTLLIHSHEADGETYSVVMMEEKIENKLEEKAGDRVTGA